MSASEEHRDICHGIVGAEIECAGLHPENRPAGTLEISLPLQLFVGRPLARVGQVPAIRFDGGHPALVVFDEKVDRVAAHVNLRLDFQAL